MDHLQTTHQTCAGVQPRAKWNGSMRLEKEDKWVSQFNIEFPPISANAIDPTREYKITFMRERGKARFDDFQAKQVKFKQAQRDAYFQKEAIHVARLKQVFGITWYKEVVGTDYDCLLAQNKRIEDQHYDQYCDQCAEDEARDNDEILEKQNKAEAEYIASLTPAQLIQYNDEMLYADDEIFEAEAIHYYDSIKRIQEQVATRAKNIANAWTIWMELNNVHKKIWSWNKMKKMIN